MQTMINYCVGDATIPHCLDKKVIAHICNDHGSWGAGFVLAVSRRWKQPEEQYRLWRSTGLCGGQKFKLGNIQVVQVDHETAVANMIAQHGFGEDGKPPIRLGSLETCLEKLRVTIRDPEVTIHMPRIGCGLAGGHWEQIGPIVQRTLCDHGFNVFVYDLPRG